MNSEEWLGRSVESIPGSVVIGEGSVEMAPVQLAPVHRRRHSNVRATGSGYIFKNLIPMEESGDGKTTLSSRILGRRWSYLRDAYRETGQSMFRTKPVDTAYWATDVFLENYYHWFCEFYPRLYLITQRDREATLLLPQSLARHSYVPKSLEPLGFKRIIYIPEGEAVYAETLFTIDPTSPKCVSRKDIFSEMQKLLRAHFGASDTGEPADRVYISRGDAAQRRVVNEEDLTEILQKHDFRVVQMGRLDFEQQVKTMLNCRHLVSLHGAGLTNMIFMKPGGRVMEIRNNNNMCFLTLANATGHVHYTLAATPTEARSPHRADVRVDPQRLGEALARLTQDR